METNVEHLYHSRRWDAKTQSFYYASDVVDLVQALEQAAQEKGLTVSRWQSNLSSRKVRVRWAAHYGERPDSSAQLDDAALVGMVQFYGLEGTSKRCEAYRELSRLLDKVS